MSIRANLGEDVAFKIGLDKAVSTLPDPSPSCWKVRRAPRWHLCMLCAGYIALHCMATMPCWPRTIPDAHCCYPVVRVDIMQTSMRLLFAHRRTRRRAATLRGTAFGSC
jgi:hypothetical protein